MAARRGHTEIVEFLMFAGADPDHKRKDGQTAANLAAQGGHLATVKALMVGKAISGHSGWRSTEPSPPMSLCRKHWTAHAKPCVVLEEQRLHSRIHDCAGFDCGIPELKDYLTRRATQDHRRNVSQVDVLVDTNEPQKVLGSYTRILNLPPLPAGTEQESVEVLIRVRDKETR